MLFVRFVNLILDCDLSFYTRGEDRFWKDVNADRLFVEIGNVYCRI